MSLIIKEKIDVANQMIDKRLGNVNIPKGLVESLNSAGFTIEIILNSTPSDIAKVLGIDEYVANIIYQETNYYYHNEWNEEILNGYTITLVVIIGDNLFVKICYS